MGGGNQFFGERLRTTTSNTTSSDEEFPNNDFFPDVDDLFGNLNMGENIDVDDAATNAVVAQAASYATLLSLSVKSFKSF
jgi:hypothetical protein